MGTPDYTLSNVPAFEVGYNIMSPQSVESFVTIMEASEQFHSYALYNGDNLLDNIGVFTCIAMMGYFSKGGIIQPAPGDVTPTSFDISVEVKRATPQNNPKYVAPDKEDVFPRYENLQNEMYRFHPDVDAH